MRRRPSGLPEYVGIGATCRISHFAERDIRNHGVLAPIPGHTPSGCMRKELPMTTIGPSIRPLSSPPALSPAAARPISTSAVQSQVSPAEPVVGSKASRAESIARRAAHHAQGQLLAQRLTGSQQAGTVPEPQRRITGWQALGIDPSSANARYLVGGIAGEAGKGEEMAIGRAMVNRMDGYHDGKQSYRGGSMRDILARPGQFSTIGHHYHGSVDQAGAPGGPRSAEKSRVRALLNSSKTAAEWAALGANHKFEWFQSPGGGRYSRYSSGNTFNGGRTRFSSAW